MFKQGTEVIIHSLGPEIPGEYNAIIQGISSTYPGGCVYIVKFVDTWFNTEDYPYSHGTFPSSLIRERASSKELS